MLLFVGVIAAGCSHAKPAQDTSSVAAPSAETAALAVATPVVTPTPKPSIPKAYVPSTDETIERLKEWDKNLHFLRTDFTQVTSYDGVEISRSKGRLFYQQDKRLLRLDTQDSDGTLIQSAVTDRKNLFMFDNKHHLITQLSWQEWQQSQPNQALFDFGNYTDLLNRHHIQAVRPHYFALTPKSGNGYTLYLTLSAQDAFPTAIKLVSDGVTTQADLINTQKNKTLPQNIFGEIKK